MKIAALVAVLVLIAGAAWSQTQPQATAGQDAIKAYKDAEKAYIEAGIEAKRADLRKNKREIIRALTNFTDEQEKAFWPVYDNHEKELIKVNDLKFGIVKEYAVNNATLTDAKALELAARTLDFQEKRVALRKAYMEELKKILPGIQVARLIQLETQTDTLIDLEVASQMPLAE